MAGEWLDWNGGLPELITSYFQQMFKATETQWEEVVIKVPVTIIDAHNEELLRYVTMEEVKFALFQMHPDKSSGQDGMTPGFFQKHWSIV